MVWGLEVGRRKLLNIGQIKNKVLMYSTGNDGQYLVINHNGSKYKCFLFLVVYMYN